MIKFGVVLFDTSSAAMQAEAILRRAKQEIKLIPTPRELSSDCGISLRFAWDQKSEVERQLELGHVDFAGIHPLSEA
ncbi:MAG: DUF3343 domain-containing protein [Anaerolineales bacterium]|jgi:hypothetical protein